MAEAEVRRTENVNETEPPRDWKLKLRYGHLKTPFQHFTTLADGEFAASSQKFGCPNGPAWMSLKVWASSADEAITVTQVTGDQVGFTITGRTLAYDTEPEEPPRKDPFAYSINFTPYDPEA